LLWEHLVLNELLSLPGLGPIHCWRDKGGREVDFVLPRGRGQADAVECKWSASSFDASGLRAFRQAHPEGKNFVVLPGPILAGRRGDSHIRFVDLKGLMEALGK
jgi:predicted AAA+ superfamily ATPase